MSKFKVTDPETLKDLPNNPDLNKGNKKILYGDFIQKQKGLLKDNL